MDAGAVLKLWRSRRPADRGGGGGAGRDAESGLGRVAESPVSPHGLPDRRRRGIARLLVDEAERRLRTLGVRRVAAMVITDHHDAIGFWSAVGYESDPRLRRFVRMP
jgi:GNAT superfamily N-acetyltransferase